MVKRWEVRFGGFGGQGIVLSSVVLGLAAVYDNKCAAQRASYGSEARGGKCKSEVIISNEEIDYPLIDNLTTLIIMSQQAYDSYINELKPGGLLIIDPDMVKGFETRTDIRILRVPAASLADKLGNRIIANMIMLGALQAETEIVSLNSLNKSVKEYVAKRFVDLNLKAIDEGRKMVELKNTSIISR
ncbi:MAG: 2-oxoacid:acceptor oxidoreductase family protein [Candidatus Bathyarchaeia archaeon]